MKQIICPTALFEGDRAIIISPSGNIDPEYIKGAKSVLESWGLDVEVGLFANCNYGRFGGTVSERLDDLQNAMDRDDIKLILCSRGGYGAVHLLEELNFKRIKSNPKWLVGYSDITALHQVFLKNNLVSLHAPMARHLTENGGDIASSYLKEILFESMPCYKINPHPLNCEGSVDGTLFGGNLSVLTGLLGTPFYKTPTDGILFIEDIAERPYKIDRIMWQFKLSGILKQLSGLIVGQFTDCEEDPLMGATIKESIYNLVKEYKYPVVFDFPVGHVSNNYPMLHGGKVHLTVNRDEVMLKNK